MVEVASEHRNVYPDAFVESFGPSLRNVSLSECRASEPAQPLHDQHVLSQLQHTRVQIGILLSSQSQPIIILNPASP
jgi:hypothetical protein